MTQPTPYVPATDFTDYQSAHPGDPPLGTDMDAEFAAIQATTDDILTNLALIQRDDGALANGVVTSDSLDQTALALIAAGGTPRGAWLTATVYAVGDIVTQASVTYICSTAHTSGVFATDLAAVKWLALSSGGDVVGPAGGATDGVPAVWNGAGGKTLKVATAAEVRTALGATATGVSLFTAANVAAVFTLLSATAAGTALLQAASATAQLNALGLYNGVVQRQRATYATYGSTSTAIPFDDTIPQNTEGSEIVTVSITPKTAGSKLRVRAGGMFAKSTGSGGQGTIALFRDTTADAIAVMGQQWDSNGSVEFVQIEVVIDSAAASATTLKLRAGPNNASDTMYWNGSSSARRFGGISNVWIEVEEFLS